MSAYSLATQSTSTQTASTSESATHGTRCERASDSALVAELGIACAPGLTDTQVCNQQMKWKLGSRRWSRKDSDIGRKIPPRWPMLRMPCGASYPDSLRHVQGSEGAGAVRQITRRTLFAPRIGDTTQKAAKYQESKVKTMRQDAGDTTNRLRLESQHLLSNTPCFAKQWCETLGCALIVLRMTSPFK